MLSHNYECNETGADLAKNFASRLAFLTARPANIEQSASRQLDRLAERITEKVREHGAAAKMLSEMPKGATVLPWAAVSMEAPIEEWPTDLAPVLRPMWPQNSPKSNVHYGDGDDAA